MGEVIEYIEVTLNDIETANRLANEVLGKTLDELPPQTRKLLTLMDDYVEAHCAEHALSHRDYHFSRRDIRQLCQWSETQVRVHMQRLVDMEYLLVHRGSRGQSFEYELLYQGEGEQGDAFLMGLLDIEHLQDKSENNTTTPTSRDESAASRGESPSLAGPSRGQRGGVADKEKSVKRISDAPYRESSRKGRENIIQAI